MSIKERANGEDAATNTMSFDTLKAAKVLQNAGVPDGQAEAQVEVLQIALSNMATKADLRADLAELKSSLIIWFVGTALVVAGLNIAALGLVVAVVKLWN